MFGPEQHPLGAEHVVWWDGAEWTCSCGKSFDDSDWRAHNHFTSTRTDEARVPVVRSG